MTVSLTNLEAIFSKALESPSPEARTAYLDSACAGDPELRLQVESLIEVHHRAGQFLASPTMRHETTPAELIGTAIGPYKLMEQIGEGGMGVVYVAEQSRPVRRRVALKVIKPGMDTRQVIARFEAERQALALMDHSNIARVLDAGATDASRPYFVMELVRGIPITEYCDEQRLSIRERLELFAHVCRAVEHAHQKGIIHRDLKPSNILVTLLDGVPVPKVIDFGVAKATGQSLTEMTLYTGFMQLVGTPLYMSPEQVEPSGLDVDTRSDIYSLGVLLYELLTGSTPFDQDAFRTAALDEMRRIIREQDPPTPSTRLGGQSRPSSQTLSNRSTDERRLMLAVRGELDWIVMKCLEKDRRRRYETVGMLGADVRRHLDNQPVEACPPSTLYRVGKFVGRNRVAVTTAAVMLLLLTILAIGSSIAASYYLRLARSEGEARSRAVAARSEADRLAEAANQARANADRRAAEAKEVVDFLIMDLIGSASPDEKQGKTVTVDQVLARADASIGKKFASQPLPEAAVRLALGQTYTALGRYEKAEEHLRQAAANYERLLGDRHVDTLKARSAHGWSLLLLNRRKEAEAMLGDALEKCRQTLGPEDPVTLQTMHTLATSLDDCERAAAMFEGLLPVRQRVLGASSRDACATMNNLAVVYTEQGRHREAQRLYEDVVRLRSDTDPSNTQIIIVMSNLLRIYEHFGEKPRAEYIVRCKEMMTAAEQRLGFEHPTTDDLRDLCFWAMLRDQPRPRRAEEAYRLVVETIARAERELGFAHKVTQHWYSRKAYLMRWEHRPIDEILAHLGAHLNRLREAFGPEAPETLPEVRVQAQFLVSAHRWEEARTAYQSLVSLYERDPARNQTPLLDAKLLLAMLHRNEGRPEEAELLLKEVRTRTTDADQSSLAELVSRNRFGPGRADSAMAEPRAPLVIEAPFRRRPPARDGRIDPGEYGPALAVDFTDTKNPGRLLSWVGSNLKKGKYTTRTADDLSYQVAAAHTETTLFIAVQVRDQFIDDQEWDRTAPHQNDYVDLYINADLTANDFMPAMILTPPYRGSREGFQVVCDAAGHRSTTAIDLTDKDWSATTARTPDGYLIEFEIPLALIDTRDGPEVVPAHTGSFLLMNLAVGDNDELVSEQTTYAALWNDGEPRGVSFFMNGEDFWSVGLRLTPPE